MRTCAKLALFLLLIVCSITGNVRYFGVGAQIIYASESFSTTSFITYKVAEDGQTAVTHEFKVTNKTPTTYLSQHTLKLSYPSLTNISAKTNGQTIEPYVVKEDTATTVTLNFDDSVVGEGQTRTFSIAYTTEDVAERLGEVLDVRIPMLSGADDFVDHQIKVVVPIQFGNPVRLKPEPISTVTQENVQIFSYSASSKESINIQFGNEQFFNVSTTYPLINSTASPAYGQIALPPDTSFQRFEYRLIDPLPDSIKRDPDGNWIATYLVSPNEELLVKVDADVRLSLDQDASVPVVQPTAEHTSEKPHWQINATTIASTFDTLDVAQIYEKVIATLDYDTARVERGELTERTGAAKALENPNNAVCQEYADVLVTGWRRAGLPARRLNGYAFTTNQSTRPLSYGGTVLHAWAEYFDSSQGLWRMVDPTWQDTTGGVDYFSQFDLNHLVFSIYGISSTEPYPAGSYADADNNTDLSVQLTDPFTPSSPQFSFSLSPVGAGSVSIPGQYTLEVTNQTGRAWYNTQISLSADQGSVTFPSNTSTFLPFEKKSIPVVITTPWQSGIIQTQLAVSVHIPNEETSTQSFPAIAAPEIVKSLTSIDTTSPVGGIALICTLAAGSLLVFRRKRKPAVRRKSKKTEESVEQLPPTQSPESQNQQDGPERANS